MRTRRRVMASVLAVVATVASLVWSAGPPAASAATWEASGGVEVDPSVAATTALGGTADALVVLTADGAEDLRNGSARRRARVDDLAARADLANARLLAADEPIVVAGVDADALEALAASGQVARVLPNRRHTVDLASSTASIGAPTAWADGYDGAGFRVAVLDTGVATSHPFLSGVVSDEACFSGGSSASGISGACPGANPTFAVGPGSAPPCDTRIGVPVNGCEHGTHVTGIVAGSAPGQGSGVAPGAQVIAVQVFSIDSSTTRCGGAANTPCAVALDADLIDALAWVRTQQLTFGDVAAANMSLGGGLYAGACTSDPLRPSIDALYAAGTPTAVASGNDGSPTSMASPACVPSAVAVGAIDDATGAVWSSSDSSPALDLLAPGVRVRSSVGTSSYANYNGTSMAAPHVAGAIAVLRQRRGAVPPDRMLTLLRVTGDDVVDLRNGRVTPTIRLDRAVRDAAPLGSTDGTWSSIGQITVSGWAFDPDTTGAVQVQIRVDGVLVATVPAGTSRPDVAAVYPGYGTNHGFNHTVTGIGPGTHQVCVTAVNTDGGLGGPSAANRAIGCRMQSMPTGNPFGNVDGTSWAGPGTARVSGWVIDPDTTNTVAVHVYVDGGWGGAYTANTSRPDVGAAYPGYGNNHGYDLTLGGLAPGTRQVCVYGINQFGGTTNPLIGCRSVTIPGGNPFGNLDGLARTGPGTARVSGWVIDPDTTNTVAVHVYVDGAWGGAYTANTSRPDVGAAYPGYGNNHGYDLTLGGLAPGTRQVCVYGINQFGGTTNPLIGCRWVAI